MMTYGLFPLDAAADDEYNNSKPIITTEKKRKRKEEEKKKYAKYKDIVIHQIYFLPQSKRRPVSFVKPGALPHPFTGTSLYIGTHIGSIFLFFKMYRPISTIVQVKISFSFNTG